MIFENYYSEGARQFGRILRWADIRERPKFQEGIEWSRWQATGAWVGEINESPIDPMTEQKLLAIDRAVIAYTGPRRTLLRLAGEWDAEMLEFDRIDSSPSHIALPVTTTHLDLPMYQLGLMMRTVITRAGSSINDGSPMTALYMPQRLSDWSIYA